MSMLSKDTFESEKTSNRVNMYQNKYFIRDYYLDYIEPYNPIIKKTKNLKRNG